MKDDLTANQQLHEEAVDRLRAEEAPKQLNIGLERRNRDLSALYEVSRTLMSTLDVQQVYQAMYREVGQKILNSPHFVIAKLAEDGQTVYCDFGVIDGTVVDPAVFPRRALGEGPVSETIRTRQPKTVDLRPVLPQWLESGRVVMVGDERRPQSAAYFPLICGDKLVGVMSAQSYEADAYDDTDLSLVTALASHAAVALENARLFEQAQREIGERKRADKALRKANRGLKLLSQSNEILSKARDEADLFRQVCDTVVDSGGYRFAWVGLAEQDEGKALRPVAQAGFEEGYLEAVGITRANTARDGGPTSTAIRTGKPAIARYLLIDPGFAPWREEALQRGYGSSVALPLLVDGQAIGALSIYASESDAFDADEIGLLTELSDNLAYGIVALRTRAERLRAEEALRRYAERLETLHQIDRAIVESRSPEAIAHATLARIERVVPCQRARITAFGAEGGQPIVLATRISETTLLGTPAIESPGPDRNAPVGRDSSPTSEISIPLMAQGELIGALQLESGTVAAFTPEQLEAVYEVGAPLAVAIHYARLHEQLRQYADRLEETVSQRTQELKAERDHTQAILESLGEAVIVTDVGGRVLYSNPASAELTGFSSEEVLGQDWQTLQSCTDSAESYRRAQQAMHARETWRGEMVNRRNDGTAYNVATTVTPLFAADDAGRLVGSVWVQRDITLLKEAERIKDQFVSNVSHELRTPLSIITLVLGNLDRLYDRLEESKRREMIQSIREQASLLNDLVGDVLEISRIDSGAVSHERQMLDLVQLVQEEMSKQAPLSRKKAQALSFAGIESLTVQGNEGQLRQVIRNLLNNAIKFTPSGGQITCECFVQEGGSNLEMVWPGGAGLPPGQWAGLRFVDTGIGIEPMEIGHLFERFYRVKTQSNIPGTGLGLAITRELVELHGGHVAVASAPGEGSVFGAYLPLPAEDL